MLWLGNAWRLSRDDIWGLVGPLGAEEVLMGMKWDWNPVGFAHVRFSNAAAATSALHALKRRPECMGQVLDVDYAKVRRDERAERVEEFRAGPSKEVWVANCWGITVKRLREAFRECGYEPVSARVGAWQDRRGRWHASVVFGSVEEAGRAMEGMRGKVLGGKEGMEGMGRPVKIGWARELTRRKARMAWYGGRAGWRLGVPPGPENRVKGDVVRAIGRRRFFARRFANMVGSRGHERMRSSVEVRNFFCSRK